MDEFELLVLYGGIYVEAFGNASADLFRFRGYQVEAFWKKWFHCCPDGEITTLFDRVTP